MNPWLRRTIDDKIARMASAADTRVFLVARRHVDLGFTRSAMCMSA
jgi:hypothetical protein